MESMLMMRRSLVTVLLTAAAAAQVHPIPLTGLVERTSASICQDRATHEIRCPGIRLRSATVDLTALEGHIVDLFGEVINVGRDCRVFEVNRAGPAVQTLDLVTVGNVLQLGQHTSLQLGATPLDPYVTFFTSDGAAIPTPFGWLQLDPRFGLFVYAVGHFDGAGQAVERVSVPLDPSLIGGRLDWQNVVVTRPHLEIHLSNSDCARITR